MKLFKNYMKYGLLILGIFSSHVSYTMGEQTHFSTYAGTYINQCGNVFDPFSLYKSDATKLMKAVSSGNVDKVEAYIHQNIDVDSKLDSRPCTIIYEALKNVADSFSFRQSNRNERLKIVELLLQAGASVNEKNGFNRSPLAYIISLGSDDSLSIVRLLLIYGAEIIDEILDSASRHSCSGELINVLKIYKQLRERSFVKPYTAIERIELNELKACAFNLDSSFIIETLINIGFFFESEDLDAAEELCCGMVGKVLGKHLKGRGMWNFLVRVLFNDNFSPEIIEYIYHFIQS